jgi:glycerol uptake facilitator-like aquaporin
MKFNLRARLTAEFIGSAFLVAAVVGSGIMGERLAGGNVAIALLANTIATGAALVALILTPRPDFWRAPKPGCHGCRRD